MQRIHIKLSKKPELAPLKAAPRRFAGKRRRPTCGGRPAIHGRNLHLGGTLFGSTKKSKIKTKIVIRDVTVCRGCLEGERERERVKERGLTRD